MAYSSGSANSFGALQSALFSACTGDGWTVTSDILIKGAVFCRVREVSGFLEFTGGTGIAGSELLGPAPHAVRIGAPGSTETAIVFPVSYEIFTFDTEVFLVINHSIDIYQWAAFGLSSVEGLPGSGMWLGATCGGDTLNTAGPLGINVFGDNTGYTSAALFFSRYFANPVVKNFFVQHGLESSGSWALDISTTGVLTVGVMAAAPLLGLLPNAWNSEAVLLPLRCYVLRASAKTSMVADLAHARITRIDNYQPGQVIQLGGDRWKVFPWYRKNVAMRNGGVNIAHTGTFGWAIRYEGP